MRAAIVGTGHIANSHIESFRKNGVDVVAAVNPHIESAELFKNKYGLNGAYSSLEELFESEKELDFISICTPTYTHRMYALQSLRAGLNVYLEKPVAMNLRETESIAREAEVRGKSLMVAYNNRYREGSQRAKSLVNEGAIGKIYHISSFWARHRGIPGLNSWFTRKELSGGGPTMDLVHTLDLALFIATPVEPSYVLSRNTGYFFSQEYNRPGRECGDKGEVNVESSSYAFVTFKDDTSLYAHTAWAEETDRDDEVYVLFKGTKGYIKLSWEDGRDILEYTSEKSGYTKEIFDSPDMGRRSAADYFISNLRNGVLMGAADSVRLMKIVDGIYRSDSLNKPVRLS